MYKNSIFIFRTFLFSFFINFIYSIIFLNNIPHIYLFVFNLLSYPSKSSSKINSNLFASKIFSGILSFFPPVHFYISGGGNIGSTAILHKYSTLIHFQSYLV